MNKNSLYIRSTPIEALEDRIAPATLIVTNANDNGAGSLRDAIDQSNTSPAKDTIVFDKAFFATPQKITLMSDLPVIVGDLDIKGSGVDLVTIDGATNYRIFNIGDNDDTVANDVSISGLSLIRGNAADGGAIFSKESLTLTNSVLSGNSASSDGGAVFFESIGSLTIKNTTILNNDAGSRGGAVFAYSLGGSILMSQSQIADNNSADRAGGVELTVSGNAPAKATITIDSCVFNRNVATTNGGGIIVDNDANTNTGKVIIKNTSVTGNVSGNRGGGLYLDDGNVTLDKVTVSGNTADIGGGIASNFLYSGLSIKSSQVLENQATNGDGGGLYLTGNKSAIITKTTFSNNTASAAGGGISSKIMDLSITASTLNGNNAGTDGGGLAANRDASTVSISKTNFLGNTAADDGGGLEFIGAGATLSLKSSVLTGNHAADNGGGADFGADTIVTATSNKFQSNTSDDGAGFFAQNSGALTIVKNVITDNRATGVGGGFDVFDGAAEIVFQSNKILNNAADVAGGGYVGTSGLTTMISNLVKQNSANTSGGLYLGQSGDKVLTSNTITLNTSATLAGGLKLGDGTTTINKGSITGNSAGTQGGGVYNNSGNAVTLNGAVIAGNSAPADPNFFG